MGKAERIAKVSEGLSFLLLVTAFVAIQVMIGGTRMIFSLPSYGLLGAVGVLAVFSLRRPKAAPSGWCLAIAGVFLAYILARAWLSPVPYITRGDMYSVFAGVIVYFYTACILTNPRQRMLFLALLLILAVVHAFVGAVQFHHGNNFMPISWLQRGADYEWRASGFYVCPNHLAGLLEALGILGLSMVCWSRWATWSKLLLSYAVGVCYVGIILTGSRGGYLSTCFSLVIFGALSLVVLRRTRGHLFWTAGGAGLVATILLALVFTFSVRKSADLSQRAQTTFEFGNMRLDLWQAALQQWKLEPIFGTGSGTYLYYGRLFRSDRVEQDPIHVHNDYLHLLAEYGLVGTAGMVLFLGLHLRRGMRNFARLGPKRVAVSQRLLSNALALNIGATAAVASYLAHSVVDFNLHIPGNLLLMAFVFGLLANDGIIRDPNPLVSFSKAWIWRLPLPLLGVALIVQCARLLPGEYYSERARMAVRDQQGGLGIMHALRGLKHDPDNPDLHYRLGQARMLLGSQMGDPEAAASFNREGIDALQRARALAPREETYGLELGAALDTARRFEEAEWVFYATMLLDPKSTRVRRYYDYHLELWRQSGAP